MLHGLPIKVEVFRPKAQKNVFKRNPWRVETSEHVNDMTMVVMHENAYNLICMHFE